MDLGKILGSCFKDFRMFLENADFVKYTVFLWKNHYFSYVELLKNNEKTIKRSKAVGEPPFMLAKSVHEALQMAVASIANYKIRPKMNAPATPEEVLSSIYDIKVVYQF